MHGRWVGGLFAKEYHHFKHNLLWQVLITLWYQEFELLSSSWCLEGCAVCFPSPYQTGGKASWVFFLLIFGGFFEGLLI